MRKADPPSVASTANSTTPAATQTPNAQQTRPLIAPFEGIFHDFVLTDVLVQRPGSPLYMLGQGGPERELVMVRHMPDANTLPVFLGAGMGHALRHVLQAYAGPVAVVDKEQDILALTKTGDCLSQEDKARICWITTPHLEKALQQLTRWQQEQGGLALLPLVHPFYQRLDRSWYGALRSHVEASQRFDFWAKARQARFANNSPRILLITSQYFLMGEIAEACRRLGIAHRLLTIPDESVASNQFIEDLLHAVLDFKPDCLLTLNHLGVDREGILMDLLEQLQMPLASWFVDNPHLIVHLYKKLISPWTAIFTWDADNMASLRHMGFAHVFHLPLGTDAQRFYPGRNDGQSQWKSRVSFVGNSMIFKVGARLKAGKFLRPMLRSFREVAARFDQCEERSVTAFLQREFPEVYAAWQALPNNERRLSYETAITWEATRVYRARCVAQTLPFAPLIVGDPGWRTVFRHSHTPPRLHAELGYYTDLPAFYPLSEINFNCTSKQMKGAVNQRIFDVPACGAFVLTDWREQMDKLFEPEKEIVFFREPEEIPDLLRYYLAHPQERRRVIKAARHRILGEHCWEHRLQSLLGHMREIYGTKAVPSGARVQAS